MCQRFGPLGLQNLPRQSIAELLAAGVQGEEEFGIADDRRIGVAEAFENFDAVRVQIFQIVDDHALLTLQVVLHSRRETFVERYIAGFVDGAIIIRQFADKAFGRRFVVVKEQKRLHLLSLAWHESSSQQIPHFRVLELELAHDFGDVYGRRFSPSEFRKLTRIR